ncbi:hypothetical protein BATDEDRAFT_85602 [Batrachochytrium dendrobatidis JAM81]|uniref:Uncharacterized protein n=1 Tax=Batrachochytrium dendrobatidis (strain JAM81 / FGSC 10211) TaxID=684364 RepID=F4NS79_BATDJ|nr:uncharacterized protein BATDEDRAFT_85602 [Batrachochytrium dendrobatidis JAM81]EGF83803.1 hypothetical protein BATDEDRAFT_85602 [Batrachochytrium dendrobatidis JAM81]|eukprot:XP_006676232.1 hypothetical protein BATDEDRAFT_85602 [Batrachochytrium dendrobatidis JAM81]
MKRYPLVTAGNGKICAVSGGGQASDGGFNHEPSCTCGYPSEKHESIQQHIVMVVNILLGNIWVYHKQDRYYN